MKLSDFHIAENNMITMIDDITEGIINALSLIEMGCQAIAMLTSDKDPAKVDLSDFGEIILAFDNDKAGRKATRRWSDCIAETPKAILPDIGGDWNDFLLSLPDENIQSAFEGKFSEFEINGELARAKTGFEYAELLFSKKHITGLFEFRGQYWFSSNKDKKYINTVNVSNFTLRTLRFQKNTTIQNCPEYTYHLEVKTYTGKINIFTATAQELSTQSQLKTLFMLRANVLWTGDNNASTALQKKIVESKAPEVLRLEITGYDLKTQCYIFKTHMIDTSGRLILPDDNGLIKVSNNEYILPTPRNTICPSDSVDVPSIVKLAQGGWGDRALVAIAWLIGAFFVNQIKAKIGFFPFLSFFKDSQTGKSFLTKLMSAFQCLDEEGIPMLKTNTAKGEIRKLAQSSGLFTALCEWPKDDKHVRFDLNQMLTLYNKVPFQLRAMKTNDLQTAEVFFLGALLFVQNAEPFKTKAQKERVISLEFRDDQLNDETRMAYDRLDMMPITDKTAFYPYIMAHRQWIENNWYDYYKSAESTLKDGLNLSSRIRETHALVLGFFNIACRILDISYDLNPYLHEIAKNKQKSCLEYEESDADLFFENLFTCEQKDLITCCKIDGLIVYINLPGAEKIIKAAGYQINWKSSDLRRCLRAYPAYLNNNESVRIGNKVQKVWTLDATKMIQGLPETR